MAWNDFGAFLLGLPSYYSKDVQTEDMTGREWQSGYYIRDRWHPSDKLTVNAGLRLEYYPLMTRATRGIERLDYSTYEVLFGGVGNVPKDVGINLKKWYLAPRVGLSYRFDEKTVGRAGYGRTFNPLPWSRPLRGSFPYDINYNSEAEQFAWLGTLAQGIPAVPIPDISSGRVKLPAGVYMRSPNPNDVNRATIQQWNVALERKLNYDIAVEVAYVGTRTDGGYADLNLNYGEPGGGNAARKYYAVAGTTAINDWASRTKSRYHGLQVAVNRPFKNGLMLKGAYTLSRAKNMADEDGWTSLTWNHPMMYDSNYALAGFDRTHVFQMGFLYELPFLKDSTTTAGKWLSGWQLNGVFAAYSGSPYSISGTNDAMDCRGCGSIYINVSQDPKPSGSTGSSTDAYYDTSIFSQPSGLGKDGFGTSGRNRFRRPPVWNLDLSLFKGFQVGRFRPEIRVEAANVLNHVNWGAPVTDYTANNFMRFTPSNAESSTNSPGARRVQLGLRVSF
jgi:outer membrane receptor protein involved in Fe transport